MDTMLAEFTRATWQEWAGTLFAGIGLARLFRPKRSLSVPCSFSVYALAEKYY